MIKWCYVFSSTLVSFFFESPTSIGVQMYLAPPFDDVIKLYPISYLLSQILIGVDQSGHTCLSKVLYFPTSIFQILRPRAAEHKSNFPRYWQCQNLSKWYLLPQNNNFIRISCTKTNFHQNYLQNIIAWHDTINLPQVPTYNEICGQFFCFSYKYGAQVESFFPGFLVDGSLHGEKWGGRSEDEHLSSCSERNKIKVSNQYYW